MRIDPRHGRFAAVFAPPCARPSLLAGAVLLALALSACAAPPEQRAADAVRTIRSWTATVRLAAESWLQVKTPSAYTRLTLRKGEQTLGDALAPLEDTSIPPQVAANLALLRAPRASAGRMARAAERGDRAAMRREHAALVEVEARLRALDERLSAAEAKR
jgi:hypothetical protein